MVEFARDRAGVTAAALIAASSARSELDLERTAEFVGDVLRRFHETPYVEGEYLSLELYVDMIQTREQRCRHDHELWGSLPPHLTEHVRDYVWAAKGLIDRWCIRGYMKLIVPVDPKAPVELFDVMKDPFEKTNLAEKQPQTVAELRAKRSS